MASRIGKRLTDRSLGGEDPTSQFLDRELVPIVRAMLRVFSSRILEGEGSPEMVVTASPGAIYQDTTGGFYVKETGTDTNTGWVLH